MDAIDKMLNGKWQYAYDLTTWEEEIDGYSIDGCAVLSESNLAFIFRKERKGVKDEIKIVQFFRDEKKQFRIEKLSKLHTRRGEIEAISPTEVIWADGGGRIYLIGNNKSGFENDIPGKMGEFGYGTIRDIKKIGDSIYAAGSWRHVSKREGENNWKEIGVDSKNFSDLNIDSGFNTVGGTGEDDIYVGGNAGDFWHFDGKKWDRIDLPWKVAIHKIEAISKDLVYLSCSHGTLFVGSKNKWRVIRKKGEDENFYQMVQFKGEIYVSTLYRMYKVVDGKLEECIPAIQNMEIEIFCHHYLSANDDIMLMCGQRSAAIFDGEFWLPFAPNGPIT